MECLILARLLPSNDSYMDCGKFRRLAVGLWILKGISFYSSEEMSASKEGADYNCKKEKPFFI